MAGEVAASGGAVSANSGKVRMGRHSAEPSACASVRLSTRPSAIQTRSNAASTGPYSFWSWPFTLYILPVFSRSRGHDASKGSENKMDLVLWSAQAGLQDGASRLKGA